MIIITMAENVELHRGLVETWASVGKGGKGRLRGPSEPLVCGPRLRAVPAPLPRALHPTFPLPLGGTSGLPSSGPGWDVGGEGGSASVTNSFLRKGRHDLSLAKDTQPPSSGEAVPLEAGNILEGVDPLLERGQRLKRTFETAEFVNEPG